MSTQIHSKFLKSHIFTYMQIEDVTKCILRFEGLQLLQEIHGGECGNHTASANLVGKAFRSGFYWPTALADTQDLVW
jgi:hypothetical protein